MLENLSEILHYSLESSQELVPLKEEVNITRCYLDIQVQRYKNQFDVIWDCLLYTSKIFDYERQLVETGTVPPFAEGVLYETVYALSLIHI